MHHDVLVFDDDADLVARYAPVLTAAVQADEAVTAILLPDHANALREALGSDGRHIPFLEPADVYVRPEHAIASYDATVRRQVAAGVSGVRLLGELPAKPAGDSDSDRVDRWARYDSLLNHAFAHHPISIHCVYDTRVASDAAIEAALVAHPNVVGEDNGNPRYQEPAARVAALAPAVEDLPDLQGLPVGAGARDFRLRLARAMADAGISDDRVDAMLLSAAEVVTNATQHAGGAPSVRVGTVDGDFVCEVRDDGPGLDDPLAGWTPPHPGRNGGAGLWVARQLTRRLDFAAAPGGGTIVRLWV
jgi:anti-sigma regulatory factor (Ser/Thr protein kinase)